MLCLLLFLLPLGAISTNVYYLEGNELSHALTVDSIVYVNFPESCEVSCRASFVLQGEDETTLHVLQDPFYDQKLLVSTEGGVLTTSDTIELDSTTLTAFRRTESITVPKGTVVVVDVLSTSIEARFALRTGDRQYSFWQTTVGFPVLVQQVRVWCFRFYYPFIYGGLCLLFFLSWPLQKKRPDTTTILSSLAMLSLLSWVGEAFYAYFLIARVTAQRSFFSFVLHVSTNLVLASMLGLTMHEELSTRRIASVSIGAVSLFLGGAGCYVCPVLLAFELVFLRTHQKGKFSSVVCKSV